MVLTTKDLKAEQFSTASKWSGDTGAVFGKRGGGLCWMLRR